MSHDTFLSTVFLKGDQVSSFDHFPFCIPAIKNLPPLELHPVTSFIGENGTGKMTLLEAITLSRHQSLPAAEGADADGVV